MSKQREEFELWYEEKIGKSICFKTYDNSYLRRDTDEAWQAWQQAQKTAVHDGYKLVPIEPSAELVNHGHQVFLGHFNEGGQTGGRSLYFAYKAMIEAGEKK